MHQQVLDFIEQCQKLRPSAFDAKTVLEAGSYDVNGTPRHFFPDAEYIGVDWREGPGVDIVCFFHQYQGSPVDFVISTEMLEHDPYWDTSFMKMASLVKPGGSLLLTCAGPGREPHFETTGLNQHYRNVSREELLHLGLYAGVKFHEILSIVDDTHRDTRIFMYKRK